MSKLAISKFFEQKLEAPLHNTVWSWGSENAKGIYLRAWNRTKIGEKFDIANSGMETDNDGIFTAVLTITPVLRQSN